MLSHPQPIAQCARFLRESLPEVERRARQQHREAVRMVGESRRPWAALGARAAAELYGCAILREGIEDEADNVTRFVWIAPEGTERRRAPGPGGPRWSSPSSARTIPAPWSTRCSEFSGARDQPDPDRVAAAAAGLGRYMFFFDLEGAASEPAVAEAIEALRAKAETVRMLGSYPVG